MELKKKAFAQFLHLGICGSFDFYNFYLFTRSFNNLNPKTIQMNNFSGAGNATLVFYNHSTNSFVIPRRQIPAQITVQIMNFGPAAGNHGIFPHPFEKARLPVVFVPDFPKQLFHDVLQRRQSRCAAVLVNNNGQAHFFLLKFAQQIQARLAFGNEQDGA